MIPDTLTLDTPRIAVNPDRGRVSARLLRRTYLFYGALCTLGLLPTLLGAPSSWQAFGWGLWLPGGGFLAAGGWGWLGFAAAMGVFGLGVLLWFVMGNLVAVPIAWLGAAALAAQRVQAPLQPYAPVLIPGLVAALMVWRAAATRRRHRVEAAVRERRNDYLPQALAAVAARAVPAPDATLRELSPDMLAGLRYLYDRTLQPPQQFQGFDIIDQFRESALRYQLNYSGYALAMAQSHYLPNFRGYLVQAQRNTIERHFENEFFDADGSIIAGRVTRTGMRFHFFDATFTRAAYCYLAHPHFPDIAERTWAMLREERVRFDGDGELDLALSFMDNLDIGNYRRTNAGMYVELLLAGREHGDDEVADAALRGLDRLHGRIDSDGSLRHAGLSNFNNAHVVMGRMMRRHDWRRLVLEGPPAQALRGPMLTDAKYPDVQVARARSDGDDLDLVLHPGGVSAAGPQVLRLGQLRPRGAYRVTGATPTVFTADERGNATLAVNLQGRTAVHLTPAA